MTKIRATVMKQARAALRLGADVELYWYREGNGFLVYIAGVRTGPVSNGQGQKLIKRGAEVLGEAVRATPMFQPKQRRDAHLRKPNNTGRNR